MILLRPGAAARVAVLAMLASALLCALAGTSSAAVGGALSIVSSSQRTVTIGWAPLAGADQFRLYKDGTLVATAGPAAVSAKFAVAAWGTYTFEVGAVRGTAEARYGIVVQGKWVETSQTAPPAPEPPPPPLVPVANAWVDLDGGTCTPTPTPSDYVNATACPTGQAALAALPATGGTVLAKCGIYPKQILTQNGKTGMTTFSSESGRCATFDSGGGVALNLMNGVSYVTFDAVTVHGRVVGTVSTGLGNNHVGIVNSDIDVGQKVNGPTVQFAVGNTISVVGNTIGASCCGFNTGGTTGQSPEGIRIGKPSTAAASCVTQVCNLTISDNLIQYAVRDCAFWPSSGFGSCPDTTCPNVVGCHADGIHIWGADNATISRNRLYGVECQGIFLENTNNSLNRDIAIVNNAISTLPGGCSNKGIYLSAGGSTDGVSNGFAGHWVIAFNGGPSQMIVANGCGSCWPSMTVDVVGNDMIFFGTDKTGNNSVFPTCVTAWGPATVTYAYNIWRPGGSNVTCSPTDLIAAPAFVNAVVPPAVGIDLHLGAVGAADGFVPAAVCGPITSTDMDGNLRPAGVPCEAGPAKR